MPRLRKGEMAHGILAKTAAAKRTVLLRINCFHELLNSNTPHSVDWIYFESVDSLSRWEDKDRGIEAISPKTLRKHMDGLYEGGLANLLRNAKKAKKLPAYTVPKSKNNSERLEYKAQMAVDSALEMTARYLDLLERLQKLAIRDEASKLELDRHFMRYGQNSHLKVLK